MTATFGLQDYLTQEQRDAGMYLCEDDHMVCLMIKGEIAPLAVFTGADIQTIQAEAHQQYCQRHNGVTFGEVR